jgi:hypothetical protein
MRNTVILITLFLLFGNTIMNAQADRIKVTQTESGIVLKVNDKSTIINGMNWDYFPVGTNYSYTLWDQPDHIIKAALDDEMSFLSNMGVNSIRVYAGIPKKWITYIYENFGIYTMLNHSFGRYGLSIDNVWYANTDYADPRVRSLLLS